MKAVLMMIGTLLLLSLFVVAENNDDNDVTGAIVVDVPQSSPYTVLISLLLILVVFLGTMFALRD